MRPKQFLAAVLTLFIMGCALGACPQSPESDGTTNGNGSGTGSSDDGEPTATSDPSELVQPSDLVYLGAFRLPGDSGGTSWGWGGMAMTYYPGGDPGGDADGYSGSLFATGNQQVNFISEISIPTPVVSNSKNLSELNTATALQSFGDVRINPFNSLYTELPRVGIAYLPSQGSQDTDKLYLAWGQHYQEPGESQGLAPTHAWCELNLSSPQTKGAWYVDNQSPYSVNDYLLDIPEAWAAANTPGRLLATGRYRDGGWSGQGPSLFAIGPWNDGNPPSNNTRLSATALLLYDPSTEKDALFDSSANTMNNYHHSDEWSGGAWLTAGNKSAVIFVGTKGVGNRGYWYGDYQDVCPGNDCGDEDRGWWSGEFAAQIIFYDPANLAAVAGGSMQPYQPQPYAAVDIDDYLFSERHMLEGIDDDVPLAQQKYRLGGAAFDRANVDRANGLLYIFEQFGDGEKPLVHVWRVQG